mmetsp:Transcript_11350/g.23692  ORF Transcript_11350/g.23692 Transcript_11350/m.23692 type:complete len:234 (+) Transcript_11350:4258-4959(+)
MPSAHNPSTAPPVLVYSSRSTSLGSRLSSSCSTTVFRTRSLYAAASTLASFPAGASVSWLVGAWGQLAGCVASSPPGTLAASAAGGAGGAAWPPPLAGVPAGGLGGAGGVSPWTEIRGMGCLAAAVGAGAGAGGGWGAAGVGMTTGRSAALKRKTTCGEARMMTELSVAVAASRLLSALKPTSGHRGNCPLRSSMATGTGESMSHILTRCSSPTARYPLADTAGRISSCEVLP